MSRIPRPLLPLIGPVVLIAIWHPLVKLSGTRVFPAPAAVFKGIHELFLRGVLFRYVLDSLERVGLGFLLGATLGVALGALAGRYALVDRALSPVIEAIRPISPLAWTPIGVVIFGVGDRVAVALIFVAVLCPVVLSSAAAVRSVPMVFRRAAQNHQVSAFQMLRRVLLPAAVPSLIEGLRTAFGVAWIVLVAAEMIAIDSGLGYLVVDARNAGKRYDLVVGAMVLIGAVGVAVDLGFRALERLPSVRWGFSDER